MRLPGGRRDESGAERGRPVRMEREVLAQCWACNEVRVFMIGVGYRPEVIACHCGGRVEVLTVDGKPCNAIQQLEAAAQETA